MEIPDFVEPVRAWRCWHLIRHQEDPTWFRLRSPNRSIIWPPGGHLTAVCDGIIWPFGGLTSSPRPSPFPCDFGPSLHGGAGCGIYGFKTIPRLAQDYPIWGGGVGAERVWGEVLLWGRVFEHDLGYRGEFARVESLLMLPTAWESETSDVAAIYGVGTIAPAAMKMEPREFIFPPPALGDLP